MPADKTLVIKDVLTIPNGTEGTIVVTYARLSPRKSIFGDWQSVSETRSLPADVPAQMIISPFGQDGLTLFWSTDKSRLDLKFDGKVYLETGPTAQKGDGTSAKRDKAHLILMQSVFDGKPQDN